MELAWQILAYVFLWGLYVIAAVGVLIILFVMLTITWKTVSRLISRK